MNERNQKFILLTVGVLVMSVLLSYFVFAWTEPSQAPPEGNVPAPLNVSINAQAKEGALIIGDNSAITTSLIVKHGNVGIGTTEPKAKLDVNGTMKVFGEWQKLQVNTTYQSPSDGFVVINVGGTSDSEVILLTDSNNSPRTIRTRAYNYSGTMSPVKKGDYFKAEKSGGGTATIYWIPLGGNVKIFEDPLVYNYHSETQCRAEGGEVVDDGQGNKMCRFNRSNCPTGWTQYENWSTTASTYSEVGWWRPCFRLKECRNNSTGSCKDMNFERDDHGSHQGCNLHGGTQNHPWQNAAREWCNLIMEIKCKTGSGACCHSKELYADVTQIGCY